MRRYSIFKRKNANYFYAQLRNPETGKYMHPKSTGKTEESEALLVVADWLQNGIPQGRTGTRREMREAVALDTILHHIATAHLTAQDAERIAEALKRRGLIEEATIAGSGPETENLVTFLRRFWDYERSEYVREKHDYGHSIGRDHCRHMSALVDHWSNFFPDDTRIIDVSRDDLKKFQSHLKNKNDYSAKTINSILSAGGIAFNWLKAEKEILQRNPFDKLRRYTERPEKRGVLTPEEAKRVFQVQWKDKRTRVGNLIAATCGLRAGEVLALKVRDVGKDRLFIRHSYSRADGLKSPKNGEEREAPLLPAVREEILDLIAENPHGGGDERFIFYGPDPAKPMIINMLMRGLERALIDAHIKPKDRDDGEARQKILKKYKDRGIVFHSWRHYFAANMADRVDMRTVQLATGHKSGAMAEHYSNHKNEQQYRQVADAVADAFGNVLEFPRKEATG